MNKKTKNFSLVIFILIFSCKTIQINQTAKVIKPKTAESSVSIGNGVDISAFNYSGDFVLPFPSTNVAYHQRFGILKNFEFQFLLYSEIGFFGVITNKIQINPKIQIIEKKRVDCSILPSVAISVLLHGYIQAANLSGGLKFLTSHDLKKSKDEKSIYYGVSTEVNLNLLKLNLDHNSFNIEFIIGNLIGFEIRNKIITRYEFGISSGFMYQNGEFIYAMGTKKNSNVNFGFTSGNILSIYSAFSISKRYSLCSQKQRIVK